MAKMLSHYTEMARAHNAAPERDKILAAVPATRPDPFEEAMFAAGGCLAPFLGIVGGLLAGFALAAQFVRRKVRSNRSEIPATNVLIIIRESGVEVAELKRFGRRIGRTLGHYELADVSYYRTNVAVDTRMMIGTIEWAVQGWFERDVRTALRPLGVALERLPSPIPYKESDKWQ